MENKVNSGDPYVKNDRVPSIWIVDRILSVYTPTHVRLIEQGGNERTATVALETLLDERYWKKAPVEE